MDNFKNVQKKNFQKLFSGIFFKEIKYYKDLSKNQGIFNILCGWLQKIPRRGDEKSFIPVKI
jgi:hypothetical protein